VLGIKLLLAAAGLGLALQSTGTPLVIAHRGASAYRPEHTLAAYALAIDMGADVVEPDVVSTKDGVLIARHENEIGGTTDVADTFPDRKTTKTIDGQTVTGWFTEDFTLAEIKTLRARERLALREHSYDGEFEIPTLEEVLTLVERKSREAGRTIGVYPETKHPAYFRGIGLPLEERLAATLARHGLTSKTSAVFIQSFEADSLKRLRALTGARLVQLVSDAADTTPARLAAIADYADGIGPDMQLVVPVDASGRTGPPTTLVSDAHAAGLFAPNRSSCPPATPATSTPKSAGSSLSASTDSSRTHRTWPHASSARTERAWRRLSFHLFLLARGAHPRAPAQRRPRALCRPFPPPPYQCVGEPSGRWYSGRLARSVISPTGVSRRESIVTPRPGRSLGYSLPSRKSTKSGR
jgi:glycerophosphoryl diester phosphodiesterase